MTTELKPCPFCGRQPTFKNDGWDRAIEYMQASISCCATIRAKVDYMQQDKERVLFDRCAAKWNRRACPDAADAVRYRWLRNGGFYWLGFSDHGAGPEFSQGDNLDAEIDAAIEKEAVYK